MENHEGRNYLEEDLTNEMFNQLLLIEELKEADASLNENDQHFMRRPVRHYDCCLTYDLVLPPLLPKESHQTEFSIQTP